MNPDERILNSLIRQESGGDPNALSSKGAAGLMQIMPATARDPGYGVRPLQGWDGVDPRTASREEQVRFGNEYLQAMARNFGGDTRLALAAYNAGPGAVQQHGGIPPYPETQNYVNNIMNDAGNVQLASNTATDWKSRARPVMSDAGSQGDWKSRATPVEASTQPDWKSRATPIEAQPEQQPSAVGDLTATIGSNLLKGGVDAAMILPNMLNEAVAGPQYLAKGIYDTFKGNPTDRNFQPYKPFHSSEDVVANSAIDYKPQTTAGKLAEIPTRLLSNVVAPAAINKVGNAVLNSPSTKEFLTNQSSGKVPKTPIKTSQDLEEMASAAFKQADELGTAYRPQDVSIPFSKAIAEIRPRPIAGKTLTSEEEKLIKHLSEYEGLKGHNLSFDEVRRIDQGLTQKINANFIDARTGQPDNNGRLLMRLQTKLREALDNIPENAANDALRNANRLWKAKIMLSDLDTIAERASMTQNVGTSLRVGYRNLYMDKDRIRSWPEPAKELLKKAATPGVGSDVLQLVASRLPALILGGTGNLGGAATAQIVGAAGRGVKAGLAASDGAKVQQSVVDDALRNLRDVKVPQKSNIPLMLASPNKMSRLPLSETQVNISRRLMEGSPPTGRDVSGTAIKPPVSQVGKLSEQLQGKDATAYRSLVKFFTNGEISQNQFVKTAKEQFGLSETQARSLAKEIKIYGAKK